ncbi:MAG: RDD family protein [Chitinophagaceae bacterium]|nr:RDD family protein [Chitinophagaceae bacterium]
MENQHHQTEETSLLADDPNLILQYEEASSNKRIVNFLVDTIFCRYAMGYGIGFLIGSILNAVNPAFLYNAIYGDGEREFYIYLYLVAIVSWVLYYTICEKAFKGVTLGKAFSGTRAMREDGSELTFKDALLRSLIRTIPFEAFSGLAGRPWHDTWTKTTVVNK